MTATTANGHPLIREPRSLTDWNPAGDTIGQLGLSNADLWPFIQVFDFTSLSDVEIVYNKGGTREAVTLTFDDPSESHTLDRQKYPQGAHVHIELTDYALNIDPTDEDTWVFDTQNGAAYYNVFDEDGNPVNAASPVSVGPEAGIDETVSIIRGAQGNDVIECQVTKDFGIMEEDNPSNDYLTVNDDGACVPNAGKLGAGADAIFTTDAFAIGFVEDGSNNNVFINYAEDQRSNIVVLDDAPRGNSFEVDYSSPGAKSGVVGHFFAELALDVPDGTWNSGERIPIVLTDGDANVNPLAEDDLTVANPHSLLVPSIRIGDPTTLASADGKVEWIDLAEDDTTKPVIRLNGGDVSVVQNGTYTEMGAVCDDDRDADKAATLSGNVDVSTIGIYTITYACTDSSGNGADPVTRTVTVVEADTVPPVITITGGDATVVLNNTYADMGATCTDAVEGTLNVTSDAADVDTTQLGDQTVTYTCTDSSGNGADPVTRTVTVVEADTVPPTITITGGDATLVQNTAYSDAGATCVDAVDGSKPADSNATSIDITILGDQTVTYTCTDSSGNGADPATRTVTVVEADTEPPTITLEGASTVSIITGEEYVEAGASCTDNTDGALNATTSGSVDTDTPDTYTLTYTCTDSSGNDATPVTRTVVVGLPLQLTSLAKASDAWKDGEFMLSVEGYTSIPQGVDLVATFDGNTISIPVNVDGNTISGNVSITDIAVNGNVAFKLVGDNNETSNEIPVRGIPTVLNLGNIDEGERWESATGDDGTEYWFPMTVHGREGLNPDEQTLRLYILEDSGNLTSTDVTIEGFEGGTARVNLTDTSISGTVNFVLAATDANNADDPVLYQSGSRPAFIPTLLDIQVMAADAWNDGALNLMVTGENFTDVDAANLRLEYNDGTGSVDLTAGGNVVIANSSGLYFLNSSSPPHSTAEIPFNNITTAGMPITFYAEVGSNDNPDFRSPGVTLDIPEVLTLASVTAGERTAAGGLSLQVRGMEYLETTPTTSPVQLFANETSIVATVLSSSDGGIFTTVTAQNHEALSGMTEVKLRATVGGSTGSSNAVNADIPPALVLTDLARHGTWNNGNLLLNVTGAEYVSGAVSLHALKGDAFEEVVTTVTSDDTTGAISPAVGVSIDDISLVGPTIFRLQSADGAVTSGNRTVDIPHALVLTGLLSPAWGGDSTTATLDISVTGKEYVSGAVSLVVPEVEQNDAALRVEVEPASDTNDNLFKRVTITEITSDSRAKLEGKQVVFQLQSVSGDNTATSNNYTIAIPNRTATTSVDMAPTPVSFSAQDGFPPITRAVIGSASEIPAVHEVQTVTTVAYTWTAGDKTVEAFSDRLRLSEPADRNAIDGKSKIVIYGWEPPTFATGVTTLFNWNFGSIPDATVTDVVLADVSHNPDTAVTLGNGASGLEDITAMQERIEALGDTVDLVIMLENTDLDHVCGDITLVADFFTFGQTPDGDRVNDAIYRIEVEEASSNSDEFEGTVEYTMLNQLNIDDPATYTGLRTISDEISIIVHEDFTDEDSVRVNYLDLGADGVSTQIAIQQAAPTHSAVVSFDAESYKVADTVTITLEDADLNVDNDVIDIYTFSSVHTDTIGDDGAFILDVTFDDELWTSGNCAGADGFSSTGFTLQETASSSGVFTGDFQIPEVYCQSATGDIVSVTGVDIEVNYQDFRDASGEEIETGAGAAVRANTGTVSLDRTVYPVPFEAGVFGHNTGALGQHDLTVHVTIDDPDFDISAAGEDVITNATEYLTVQVIRGSSSYTIDLNDARILETAPDSGAFELDLPIAYNDGPAASNGESRILQGDILQVEYRDPTDASGEENTVTDSATFDLRNGVLQSDKSVYIIGSDMILTLIEPDFDLENDGAESYTLDLIEWDSDAATLGMDNAVFDPEPSELRETGDSTGIFQVIAEIPAEIDGDRLERGEEIELEYVDYGPSGSDYVGEESEDVNLTVYTSNFGATIELDQKVYTWTDKVYITIVAPDHNFDSALVDEIGESDLDPIQVSTRSADIDNYKLVETGPDTGIFTGEVILIGFDHNADGDTETGTAAGYDNPARSTSQDGSGPTNGYLQTDDDDGITVSFEYSEDETVVGSALIRWNIGEVQWLESSYPASGTGVVRVIDPDMNWNPEAVDNFVVDVWSDADNGGIDLTVTETNEATGIFEGTVFFTITDESSGHRLRVAEGNTVTAEYEDNTLPDPYTTADELDITATTLIGTIVPPLERAPATNLRIVDAFGNSLDAVSADQQVQIVADLANGQDRSQAFAYLVQVQDANGVTVALSWISGTLEAGQSLSPSTSWIPSDAGAYTATAFVWESVDNPTALSPPVTTDINVS